ncbi:hypothetical protein BZG02_12410 [Labilibaculum filiforme]|uniref:Uncharacterized protein n=1 Tax=Labilibaculum filiforme TaxID=1940526 RepID=A0A2N3HWU1_9BACT|nr:hypothetical protein [Labilibaculum filiforme]PKQ62519.1 hypothetical protein BZG02_12410 [Labilibaculum filiforme]
MIDLSNEMYITKDVYRALVDYGNILLVDLLRKAINLEEKEDEYGEIYISIREEFQTLAFQDGQSQNHYFEELSDLTTSYLKGLKDSDKTALCFRLLEDDKYYNRLLENVDDADTMQEYDLRIGREMARFIYQEDKKELMEWCMEFLMDMICVFSTEFDFSLIDESLKDDLEYKLNEYRNPVFMNFSMR